MGWNLPDDWDNYYTNCHLCGGLEHPSGTAECNCIVCSRCGESVPPDDLGDGDMDRELCEECATCHLCGVPDPDSVQIKVSRKGSTPESFTTCRACWDRDIHGLCWVASDSDREDDKAYRQIASHMLEDVEDMARKTDKPQKTYPGFTASGPHLHVKNNAKVQRNVRNRAEGSYVEAWVWVPWSLLKEQQKK